MPFCEPSKRPLRSRTDHPSFVEISCAIGRDRRPSALSPILWIATVPFSPPASSHCRSVSSATAPANCICSVTVEMRAILPEMGQTSIFSRPLPAAACSPSRSMTKTRTPPDSAVLTVKSSRGPLMSNRSHRQRLPLASPSTTRLPAGVNCAAVIFAPPAQPESRPVASKTWLRRRNTRIARPRSMRYTMR